MPLLRQGIALRLSAERAADHLEQEEKSISFRADEEGDLVVSRGIWNGSFADCRYCADCGIFLLERPAQPSKFGERLRGTFGRLRGGDTTE